MTPEIFLQFAVSLGLGLLVGFQREWTAPHVAGIRTFAIVTVFGTVSGHLAESLSGWVLAAGVVAVTAVLVFGEKAQAVRRKDEGDFGITTEIAVLLMYVVGALLVFQPIAVGVMVAGAVAVLLHWKDPLHRFVQWFGTQDVEAVFQLVLIALVILPVLPNETYGPYDVLNPFEIWLVVVLVCGISLGGYIVSKFAGERVGSVVSGVFGGIISSTATTVSYSRRTRHSPEHAASSTLVILIASTIVFGRVLFEIAVIANEVLPKVAAPLLAMMAWMAVLCGVQFLWSRHDEAGPLDEDNPSELSTAVVFGLLYAIVLFGVAAAKENFGDRGLYVVSVLSGLTDMDAITLSTAKLIREDRILADTGWRMILVGAMSNLVFKGLIVAALGSRRLLRHGAAAFGAALFGGAAILLFWPGG